jgi:hypothetical protein
MSGLFENLLNEVKKIKLTHEDKWDIKNRGVKITIGRNGEKIYDYGGEDVGSMGFIQPDGVKYAFDEDEWAQHMDFAEKSLRRSGVDPGEITNDTVLSRYGKLTGEIRYKWDDVGLSVEVFTKITPAQMRTITKAARESNGFYWDVWVKGDGHGSDFTSFRSFVEKHGLIR